MNLTEPLTAPGTSEQNKEAVPQEIVDFCEPETTHCEERESFDEPLAEREIDHSHLGLIELILKNRRRLHRLIRSADLQPTLISRLLAISLIGFVFYGVAMSLVLNSAGLRPQLFAMESRLDGEASSLIQFTAVDEKQDVLARWFNGTSFHLIAAYALGLIAATGVCLPSLYFYGLLAGVKMSMRDVTIHALKSKATTAVALVGILPIYAALSMGMVIFSAPEPLLKASMLLGLLLPFIAGFWGTRSLYVGFATLCDTMPVERRERRECFLRRLVLSWSACYSAVMPVMIFTLWQSMGS